MFYVGTLKGVGHIDQQTSVDTYAKVGFACPSGDAQPNGLDFWQEGAWRYVPEGFLCGDRTDRY